MKFIGNLAKPGDQDNCWPTHLHLRGGRYVFSFCWGGDKMDEIIVLGRECKDEKKVASFFGNMRILKKDRHILLFDPLEEKDDNPNIDADVTTLFVCSSRDIDNTLKTVVKARTPTYIIPAPSLMEMRVAVHAQYHLSNDFDLKDKAIERNLESKTSSGRNNLAMTMNILENRVNAIGCLPRHVFTSQSEYTKYKSEKVFRRSNEFSAAWLKDLQELSYDNIPSILKHYLGLYLHPNATSALVGTQVLDEDGKLMSPIQFRFLSPQIESFVLSSLRDENIERMRVEYGYKFQASEEFVRQGIMKPC
jgi:hypothetical protein